FASLRSPAAEPDLGLESRLRNKKRQRRFAIPISCGGYDGGKEDSLCCMPDIDAISNLCHMRSSSAPPIRQVLSRVSCARSQILQIQKAMLVRLRKRASLKMCSLRRFPMVLIAWDLVILSWFVITSLTS